MQPYSSPHSESSWHHKPESGLEPVAEEEGGGPVKTFIEHLEDLRWTLIKCAVAYAVSFILCLSGANYITGFLKWPLEQAMNKRVTSNHSITYLVGTNVIGREPTLGSSLPGVPTNASSVYRLTPVQIGTNWVAAFQIDTNPPVSALRQSTVELKNFGPISAFNIVMQIALYGGLTVAAPFLLLFIGQFVLPALHVPEKKFLYKVAGWASFLFLLGVTLCYLIFLIICLSTTVSFSNWLGFGSDQWQAEQYISFVLWFMVGMGVAFQLPLVLLTLVKIGILDAAKLSSFRMYWVVIGMVIAAFITPDGNPINMVILFLPLEILYEITVIVAWYWDRKAKRMAAEADSGAAA